MSSAVLLSPDTEFKTPGAVLSRNLVLCRRLAGVTQHELASSSGVSRATIAQIESGISDPRLSTVFDLATALGIAPIVLLGGPREIFAIASLAEDLARRPVAISESERARMEALVESGSPRDRGRAAHLGACVARAAGEPGPGPTLTAGLFAACAADAGACAGVSLGRLLAE